MFVFEDYVASSKKYSVKGNHVLFAQSRRKCEKDEWWVISSIILFPTLLIGIFSKLNEWSRVDSPALEWIDDGFTDWRSLKERNK